LEILNSKRENINDNNSNNNNNNSERRDQNKGGQSHNHSKSKHINFNFPEKTNKKSKTPGRKRQPSPNPSQQNKNDKDCCTQLKIHNMEYVQQAIDKIKRVKSPSREKNLNGNVTPGNTSKNFSKTITNDDDRKILTSTDLKKKTEDYKMLLQDVYEKKNQQVGKALNDLKHN
jgi:hypothetical protein